MGKKKIRIAVPYLDRFFGLPSPNIGFLAEALWNATNDACEVVKMPASDLLKRDDYEVVFLLTRRVAADQASFDHFARTGVRVAVWLDDLHFSRWRVPYPPKQLTWLFERADLVFVTYLHQCGLWKPYRKFLDKAIWSPWSVPDWIFEYSQAWEARANRVLLAGMCGMSYPLRRRVARYARDPRQNVVDVLEHPGRPADPRQNVVDVREPPGSDTASRTRGTIGREFFKLLGSYKGAVATTLSNWRYRDRLLYTVAKYIEIPACGCLPFMEKTPDLGELGFREGEHYIAIDRRNYQKRLSAIHSTEACEIARAAQELVRQRHTHSHRVNMILQEITRRCGP